ncbi:hypothetical protein KEM55_006049 [Ascosphaera atra]|nr:hypothetical protein KEM55_006049 [Ascosphaera atra]
MPFGVISIRSGSDMQYASWGASQSMIGAGLSQQNASCNTDPYNAATFQIRDGALYLYSTQNPPQEVYVDRSGMGQGVIGYTTGAQPAVSGAERKGWAIDGEYLTFKGQGFIACPARDGFSVWVDTGVENPGFNEGCEGIAARTIETSNPADCLYSEQ